VAPLVGIAGAGTAIPMGIVIAVSVMLAASAELAARADDPHARDG
jgi:hypothetical protein